MIKLLTGLGQIVCSSPVALSRFYVRFQVKISRRKGVSFWYLKYWWPLMLAEECAAAGSKQTRRLRKIYICNK